MLVVVIVGILAAIVVAGYHSMTGDARISGVVHGSFRWCRSQLQLYQFNHSDTTGRSRLQPVGPNDQHHRCHRRVNSSGTFSPLRIGSPAQSPQRQHRRRL